MTDNPMDSVPSFNRVSIRAVLVTDGEDPGPALAEAGIFDPIAVPVVLGDDATLSGGILGDAVTPNLTAVLEPDQAGDWQEDDWESSSEPPPNRTSAGSELRQPEKPTVTTLPEAFGHRPFAPVVRKTGA
jgi:hypothetical protein